jgi:hypothetical protein
MQRARENRNSIYGGNDSTKQSNGDLRHVQQMLPRLLICETDALADDFTSILRNHCQAY